MNQFTSIYGQLFCCSCPVGFAGAKCDNVTGVVIFPNPASSYAWVAGVLCVLVLTIVGVALSIIYCRRKRNQQEGDVISIIKFRNALLKSRQKRAGDSDILIEDDGNAFENPGFERQEEDFNWALDAELGTSKCAVTMSSSIEDLESIDSAFLSRHESMCDADRISAQPLTQPDHEDTADDPDDSS